MPRRRESKPWGTDGRKVPPQLVARIKGSICYICPHCHKMCQWVSVNWRMPRRECQDCGRKLQFGLVFDEKLDGMPPYNGRVAVKDRQDPYNNRVNWAEGETWIGEVTGVVDYFCPKCLYRQRRAPTQPECWLKCERCSVVWYVKLIVWKLQSGTPPILPDDWIMPGVNYADPRWAGSPITRLRALRRGAGEDCGGLGTAGAPEELGNGPVGSDRRGIE